MNIVAETVKCCRTFIILNMLSKKCSIAKQFALALYFFKFKYGSYHYIERTDGVSAHYICCAELASYWSLTLLLYCVL